MDSLKHEDNIMMMMMMNVSDHLDAWNNDMDHQSQSQQMEDAGATISGERSFKKYVCEYDGCYRSYTTAGNLKTHIKIHRGNNGCVGFTF